ncbi:MAG: hypothetical protein M1831_004774 [Alyxoria varia]|nr:MAG: hypothetical protein M1831_004774 [Alyxoria varia]
MGRASRLIRNPSSILRSTLLLALPLSTFAQRSASPSEDSDSPSRTSSASVTTHTVTVGKGNHNYDPDTTYAEPGDIVRFFFYPTNHSVTKADYGYPCLPYELIHPGRDSFHSGGIMTQSFRDPPEWDLKINNSDPIFYYCTAIDSCIGNGMVGAINPNNSVSVEQFKAKAEDADVMLSPGQEFPAEGTPTAALTPSAGAATVTLGATPGATVNYASSSGGSGGGGGGGDDDDGGLSGGAIAGIVIAVVAFLALLAGFFWLLGRRRGNKEVSGFGGSSRASNIQTWANSTAPDTVSQPGGGGGGGGTQDMYQHQRTTWDSAPTVGGGYPSGTQSPGPYHGQTPSTGGMGGPGQQQYFAAMTSPGLGEDAATAKKEAPEVHEVGNNFVSELEAPHAKGPPEYEVVGHAPQTQADVPDALNVQK